MASDSKAAPSPPLEAPARYLLFASTAIAPPNSSGDASALTLGNVQGHNAKLDSDAVSAHLLSIGFIPDAGSITSDFIDKKEAITKLAAFMRCDAPMHVLCWFGHGASGTGDWHLAGAETLSLLELLKLWVDSHSDGKIGHLFVLSDCCYSGGWVRSALGMRVHELWPRHQLAFTLQCSVSDEHAADSGVFTRQFWLPLIAGTRTPEMTLQLYGERKALNAATSGLAPSAFSSLEPTLPGLVSLKHVATSDVVRTIESPNPTIKPHRWCGAVQILFPPFKPQPANQFVSVKSTTVAGWNEMEAEKRQLIDELVAVSLHADFFDSFVADKLKDGFTGRVDLFTEIKQFLAPAAGSSTTTSSKSGGKAGERVFLITGEPGIGKSTAMACILALAPNNFIEAPQLRELISHLLPSLPVIAIVESYLTELVVAALRDQLIASHICMASNSITLEPMRFVRSLAVQFCRSVTGFSDRLTASPSTRTALRSTDHTTAFVSVLSLLTASQPKCEPVHRLGSALPIRFILVDSLDEALCFSSGASNQSIASLLSSREVMNALPEWIRVVATSRPERDVLSLFEAWHKPLISSIKADGRENRKDVESFIRSKLAIERMTDSSCTPDSVNLEAVRRMLWWSDFWALARSETAEWPELVLDAVCHLSAGNFLVASEMVRSVTLAPSDSDGFEKWSLAALQSLVADSTLVPGSLSAFYTAFMNRQSISEQKWRVLRLIIEVLLASKRPIPVARLCYAVRLTESKKVRDEIELETYLRLIQPFTRREIRNIGIDTFVKVECISLYHKSFSDWLRTQRPTDRYAVSVAAGHRRLAAAALLVSPKITPAIEQSVTHELLDSTGPVPRATHTHPCTEDDSELAHCIESHFNSSDLIEGAVSSSQWPAIGSSALCYGCYWHLDYDVVERNDIDAVRAIRGIWKPKLGRRALKQAIELGRLAIIELLWPLCKPNEQHNSLGRARDRETIDLLVRLGAHPAETWSGEIQTLTAVQYIFGECGRDINELFDQPFSLTVDALRWACSRRPNVHRTFEYHPLCYSYDNLEYVRVLLAAGFDPNDRTSSGSVLMRCQNESIELLLEACDPLTEMRESFSETTRQRAEWIETHPKWGPIFVAAAAAATASTATQPVACD